MAEHQHKPRTPRSPTPVPKAADNVLVDEGDASFKKVIGDYLFTIAAADTPPVPNRWELIVEHLAAWLLDEWQHEQGGGSADSPSAVSNHDLSI